jgi:hypothetical protein
LATCRLARFGPTCLERQEACCVGRIQSLLDVQSWDLAATSSFRQECTGFVADRRLTPVRIAQLDIERIATTVQPASARLFTLRDRCVRWWRASC